MGLAVDSYGDVVLAGHAFEGDGGLVDGRKDAIVMKLASRDGESIWSRCGVRAVLIQLYYCCGVSKVLFLFGARGGYARKLRRHLVSCKYTVGLG